MHVLSYIPVRYHTAWIVVMAFAASLVSCSIGDDNNETGNGWSFDSSSDPLSGISYEGIWTAGNFSSTRTVAVVNSRYITLYGVPYDYIFGYFFSKSDIVPVSTDHYAMRLDYTAASISDNTILYSIVPAAYTLSAMVDGTLHKVEIELASTQSGQPGMSWGKLSRNGVFCIALNIARCSIDGGEPQSVQMKMTFTATK